MITNRLKKHWPGGPADGQGNLLDHEQLEKRLGLVAEQAEQFVKRHPRLSLAMAVAAGVTLGWLVKRK
jgi:ElaB/YqjD/DUF883 family membrane-anchored ribosome-binding protein